MTARFYSNAGNTEEVAALRLEIKKLLKENEVVQVYLLQPGIMYQKGTEWLTVVDFMNEFAHEPVHWFSNLVPIKKVQNTFSYTNDMFFMGNRLYKTNNRCASLLKKLAGPELKKDLSWDLLLGERSDNKDLLHDMIKDHTVKSKTFLTYYGKDTSKGHWGPDVERPIEHTAESIGGPDTRWEGNQLRCSDLIDPTIYNQTYYTAAIETVIHEDFAMFSEKEAKPIVAKRPFVLFGSPGHMKAFRKLGYKSFGDVIDESYDEILDKEERWHKVLDAMDELCNQDPLEVYKTLKPVLEHNKKHFQEKSWKRGMRL
tara:strand:- start:4692 stop:5633 length:942 start_codon:yes stop_codon:yes gene_type:complete